MKRVTRATVHCETSRFNPPGLTAQPGETVIVETELCTGDWLHSLEDCWSTRRNPGVVNPASGPIYVQSACSGDVLAVRIDDVAVDGLGYTGFAPYQNAFPDWI